MRTRLMNRIFSAISNNEELILDQLERDLDSARSNGDKFLKTEEYSIKVLSNNVAEIFDNVNEESTMAVFSDNGIQLSPKAANLIVGGPVTWIDGSGKKQIGTLIQLQGSVAKVKLNGSEITVDTMLLSQGDGTLDRNFSKKRASMFLVDENGNLKAYGWLSSLMALKLKNPTWKIITNYDWNAIQNGLKNIKQFSEAAQKEFTKTYRIYAVIDKNNKLIGYFDITNAKGLVKSNPGYTAIKRKDYWQSIQPKIKNFSRKSQADNTAKELKFIKK